MCVGSCVDAPREAHGVTVCFPAWALLKCLHHACVSSSSDPFAEHVSRIQCYAPAGICGVPVNVDPRPGGPDCRHVDACMVTWVIEHRLRTLIFLVVLVEADSTDISCLSWVSKFQTSHSCRAFLLACVAFCSRRSGPRAEQAHFDQLLPSEPTRTNGLGTRG